MRHEIKNPFAAARVRWSSPRLRSVAVSPEEVSTIVDADDPASALIQFCRWRELISKK